MSPRFATLLATCAGIIATVLVMLAVANVWAAYPPADMATLQASFWANHPLPPMWYQQLPIWALYLLTLLTVWPLVLVLVAGGLATWLVVKRVSNDEASAYMERIHILEFANSKLTKERDDLADQWNALTLALDHVFDTSGELWLVLGRDGRIRRWNQASMEFGKRFHPNLETLEGRPIADMWRNFASSPIAKLPSHPQAWHGEMQLAEDGIHMLCWTWPLGDDLAILARNITSKHTGAETLQTSEAMLRSMVEQSLRPLVIMDTNWRYLYVAQSWATFFHLDTQVALTGKLHTQVLPHFPLHLQTLAKQLADGQRVGADEEKLLISGREEVVKWALRPWRDHENRLGGYILTITPVTELVRLRAQLKQGHERENTLAYSDTLTGLPNRQLFNDRLNMALATAFRQLSKIALIFIDLDGFKKVNDTLGHDYGDMLLKQVALRLQSTLRDTDTVARLGGDEFVIILGVRDKNDAEMVAQKVLKVLGTPFDLNGKPANIGGSLGIAMYPMDGNTAADLIKKADAAMYEAKNSGKNTYRFATKEMMIVG